MDKQSSQVLHVNGVTEYVTVTEEVVYQVPKKEYKNKTYIRPRHVGNEVIYPVYVPVVYEKPVYEEKRYIVPVLVDKEYEKPVIKEIEKEYLIPRVTYTEEVNIIEVPYEVRVPEIVKHDVHIDNAIVSDKKVINAVIEDVHVDAIHPHYVCKECGKEINP